MSRNTINPIYNIQAGWSDQYQGDYVFASNTIQAFQRTPRACARSSLLQKFLLKMRDQDISHGRDSIRGGGRLGS